MGRARAYSLTSARLLGRTCCLLECAFDIPSLLLTIAMSSYNIVTAVWVFCDEAVGECLTSRVPAERFSGGREKSSRCASDCDHDKKLSSYFPPRNQLNNYTPKHQQSCRNDQPMISKMEAHH